MHIVVTSVRSARGMKFIAEEQKMGCAKSGLRGGLKGQNVAHSYAWATFAARIDMAFEPNRRRSVR